MNHLLKISVIAFIDQITLCESLFSVCFSLSGNWVCSEAECENLRKGNKS